MPKIQLAKTKHINAPVEKVFAELNQFDNWSTWSPWIIMEPEAKVNVHPGSKSYDWEGKRVGSGNMAVTGEEANKTVDYDLNFLKPWKSHAKVKFEVNPAQDGTEVTWHMDSSLPFFMFWMKKMMTTFIGMDYDRGLTMLKDYIEDGEVHSKLELSGQSEYPGCTFVGIKSTVSFDNIGPQMEKDLFTLSDFMKDKMDLMAGPPLTIYHKWDMAKGMTTYTSAFPVSATPEGMAGNMYMGTVPATKTYKISHQGPYDHLGNAWTAGMQMSRGKEFKQNKKIDPFEVYVSDPASVATNEIITEVHFPIQ